MDEQTNNADMLSPLEYKTLKLDAAYRPIEIINGTEALVMCLIGKARTIETYDKVIRSPSQVFRIPSVIVLCRVVKFQFQVIDSIGLSDLSDEIYLQIEPVEP